MFILRRYNSYLLAEQAAQALRAHGIGASVAQSHFDLVMSPLPGISAVQLLLHDRGQRPDAEAVLKELDESPPEIEEGWEDRTAPDASSIDTERWPLTCRACGARLDPSDAQDGTTACPSCGTQQDVLERLVDEHGPEAVAEAMEETAAPGRVVTDEEVEALHLACRSCAYDLAGLPLVGECPECGAGYDKDALLGEYL